MPNQQIGKNRHIADRSR